MRTYYRGRDAMVTSELFVARATSTKSYTIRHLRNVCIACDQATGHPGRPLTAAAVGFLGLSGSVAALAAGSPDAVLLTALATALAVAGTLLWPRPPAVWELRASYLGRAVRLYESRDATVFNQVTRALRRAIEDGREPPPFEQDDAA